LPSSDAELVKAACAGDIDSFRELFERHQRMAVGIARSRLFDRHLAEDAAQEAFALACQRLHSLRDGNRFAEWLGTMCRRIAGRMARARIRTEPIQQEPVLPDSHDGDDVAQVERALQRLSTSAREVIQLHYYSDLSYDEIARALGISPQAVHGRMQRARRLLARRLSNVEEGGDTDG
jgi:RNA polymerase sigma-70 factor, ECF subfamily